MAFEESAAQALDELNGLLAAARDARSMMLDMRDRVLATTTRFDSDWVLLRERARAFLEQAAAQEQQLVALKSEAARAVASLRDRVEVLQEQGTEDAQATQLEMDALATDTDDVSAEVLGVLQAAEASENALEASLRQVEAELARVVGDADDLMRSRLVGDVRQVEQEVERAAIELSAYFSGQCLPILEQKAYDLYNFLVQAEEEVRTALEVALEANESTADAVLRDTADNFDDTMGDLGRLASALDDLLTELREFVDDGRQKLDDRKRRWDESVRRGREGLRDALESLEEVQQYLARFSFGR